MINEAFAEVYPDFEDAVQYFSAKASEADLVITRNKEDFTMVEESKLMTPIEFLDFFFAGDNAR